MKKGKEIYQRLCSAGHLDTAVEDLTAEELTAVSEYLATINKRGGVPAQIWGLVSARLSPETLNDSNE